MSSTTAAPATADSGEIDVDVPGFFRIYKNGTISRFTGTQKLPASLDPLTGVNSKDITVDPSTALSVRLYLPPISSDQKLPLLIYFHGGAFFLESSSSPVYHRHLNTLSTLTPLLAVSVDYRLAPESPLPAAYEDSWIALRWVFSRSDPWIFDHADLNRVFVAGDSAGANISHHMAMRSGEESVFIKGVALIHPYFWGSEAVGSESGDLEVRSQIEKLWRFACPNSVGIDDPMINPMAIGAPDLGGLGCEKLMVFVADRDVLKERGKVYYERVKESGWGGEGEIVEAVDSEHVFHLFNPDSEKAKELVKILVDFFNK